MNKNLTELPTVPLFLKIRLPEASGIYFVRSRNVILYIGKAQNLRDRWIGSVHHRFEQLSQFDNPQISWFLTDDIDTIETAMIEQFKPLLNGVPVPKSTLETAIRKKTDEMTKGSNKRLSLIRQHICSMSGLFGELQTVDELRVKTLNRLLSQVTSLVEKYADTTDIVAMNSLTCSFSELSSLSQLEHATESRFVNEYQALVEIFAKANQAQ